MREILYKNLLGLDNKKRDLCVKEIISRDDFMATIERRCRYFVRKKVYLQDPNDLDKLNVLKKHNDALKKKHFHILRTHDSISGKDKFICKIAGTFYAIAGHYIFSIAYIHSFKIDLAAVPISE